MVLEKPWLVVVGAASRDLDESDPRGWRLGGTVTYASLAAAALGVHVAALIGVDADSQSAHELQVLRGAGVEVRTVGLASAPIFDNRQTPDGRVQHALGESDPLPLSALPEEWRAPDAALLGPVAAELDDSWAHVFEAETALAFAAQGALRRLSPGRAVERLPIIRSALWERADRILISSEDVVPGAPPIDELLSTYQRLVVTHGERGAVYLEKRAHGTVCRYLPATPRREAVDTTGAGDTFLGAWVAGSMLFHADGRGEEWRALLIAAVMASISVTRRALAEMPTRHDLCEELVRLRDQRLG